MVGHFCTVATHSVSLLKMLRSVPVLALLVFSCGVSQTDLNGDDPLATDDAALKKNPCVTVRCSAGFMCKAKGQRAECVRDPAQDECVTDADCRLEDNYCGGCSCLPLSTNEQGPTCTNPVNCFASPCAVSSKKAACVNGQCTSI